MTDSTAGRITDDDDDDDDDEDDECENTYQVQPDDHQLITQRGGTPLLPSDGAPTGDDDADHRTRTDEDDDPSPQSPYHGAPSSCSPTPQKSAADSSHSTWSVRG